MSAPTIVQARDLSKDFPVRRTSLARHQTFRAVDRVSFDIASSETLGLVGESGSGKSTIGRMLVGLLPESAGSIELFGRTITGPGGANALAAVRSRMQFVFQDPFGSLNPRMRIGDAIAEPLAVGGGSTARQRNDRVREMLELVGLPMTSIDRYPHEFSGGQRQRIVIARALSRRPELVVCDEPVSALDVSVQAQIINLLLDLQDRFRLSYLFIAHDLAVVRSISTRIAVLYCGAVVEIAPKADIYRTPRHPYTQALLEAVPRIKRSGSRRAPVTGELPSAFDPPSGCRFHTRCPYAIDRCRTEAPMLRELGPGHSAACHRASESIVASWAAGPK